MGTNYYVDALSPTASNEIKEYLCLKLKKLFSESRPIIFLCIGTDRSTGDSLGPLVGYKLKSIHLKNIYIYGSLELPIHAKNLTKILDNINDKFNNPFIIAIDSSLGKIQNVGKVFIAEEPLNPGLAMNKDLPSVGELSIKGIVNISGSLDFTVLQNTRLYTVMALADCISKGIESALIKLSSNTVTDSLSNSNQ